MRKGIEKGNENEQENKYFALPKLKRNTSTESTGSSVFDYQAEQNNAAHSFFKYYFAENKAGTPHAFSFNSEFSNAEVTIAPPQSLIYAAIQSATASHNHLELLDNVLSNLQNLLRDVGYTSDKNTSDSSNNQEDNAEKAALDEQESESGDKDEPTANKDTPKERLEKLVADFEIKKARLTRLHSIIHANNSKSSDATSPSIAEEILKALNEEIIDVCSKVFEKITLSALKEETDNNQHIRTPNASSASLDFAETDPISEENKLLSNASYSLSSKKYDLNESSKEELNATLRQDLKSTSLDENNYMIAELPPEADPEATLELFSSLFAEPTEEESNTHSPIAEPESAENPDNSADPIIPESPQESFTISSKFHSDSSLLRSIQTLIEDYEAPGTIFTKLVEEDDINPEHHLNYLRGKELSKSTVERSPRKNQKEDRTPEFKAKNDIIRKLVAGDKVEPIPTKGKPLPTTDFISFDIDENLTSTFSVSSKKRPFIANATDSKQKDHVTAYCALLVAAINSIPSTERSRNLPQSVKEIVNLVLATPLPIEEPEVNFDEIRRNQLKEFASAYPSLNKQDRDDINKLLKTRNLRSSNQAVCKTINSFLSQMNQDPWASFEQGGQDRKSLNEGEAINYMAEINEAYHLVAASVNPKTKDSEVLQQELLAFSQKHPNYLKKVKNDLGEETWKVVPNTDSILGKLPQYFAQIFDLSYPHFRDSEALKHLGGEDKEQNMRKTTQMLLKRHFKILGAINSSSLVEIKNHLESTGENRNPFREVVEKFLDNFFQEPVQKVTSDNPNLKRSGSDYDPNLASESSDVLGSNENFKTLFSQHKISRNIASKSTRSYAEEEAIFDNLEEEFPASAGKIAAETPEEIFELNKQFLLHHLTNFFQYTATKANMILNGYRQETYSPKEASAAAKLAAIQNPTQDTKESANKTDTPTQHFSPNNFASKLSPENNTELGAAKNQ